MTNCPNCGAPLVGGRCEYCGTLSNDAEEKIQESHRIHKRRSERMSNQITFMDCWHFIAPLIPVNSDHTMDIYVMVFGALKEAEKKRIAEKKKAKEEQQQ